MKISHLPQAAIVIMALTGILISAVGCEKKTGQRLQIETVKQPTVRARPCNVLLIGIDGLADAMERQWKARHETALRVTRVSRAKFKESGMHVESDINVLVYPADMMVELIDNKRIDPLGKVFYDSSQFNKFALLKHHRKSGMRFDGQPFAAPCGGPMFVQIYRKDLLDSNALAVPETWQQLIETQDQLANSNLAANSDAEAAMQVAVPLAEGWAASTFLAISSPYVRQFGRLSVLFDRKTMKPMLESAGFVRALEELKQIAERNPEALNMDPAAVYQALRSGRAAIGLTWPSTSDANGDSIAMDQLRVSQVPGTVEYFDTNNNHWTPRESNAVVSVNYQNMPGIMASNVRSRGRKRAGEQFMAWLTDPSISELLFGRHPRSGPFRATHLAKLEAWGDDQANGPFRESWSRTLRESHEQSLIMTFPKIARSGEYLALLDKGIRKCVMENVPSAEALMGISRQWEVLTESTGRPGQIRLLDRNASF